MSPLLPSECPNCGRLHSGHDFNAHPGPVQARLAEARRLVEERATAWEKDAEEAEFAGNSYRGEDADAQRDLFNAAARSRSRAREFRSLLAALAATEETQP